MPPEISTDAERWIAHALALARRGVALASPNPMVGAVLVRNKRAVGEGFHTYQGMRHAEVVAIEDAGDAARGSTLYVSLEPCCNTGRTGPCTRALIAAGVARVVAAMPDPNPSVAGRGFRALRSAGIEVEIADSREEFERLNEAFAKWITTKRPFVTLKSAMTLDGQLVHPLNSAKPSARRPRWITSETSRAEVQRMRHASDAILTGIGTVLADDPQLTDRTGLPRRRPLLRVILDSRLQLNPSSKLVRSAHGDVLVFTCASAASARARALRRAGVEVVECDASGAPLREIAPARKSTPTAAKSRGRANCRPDLRAVLAELGRREMLSVMLEAGATLNQSALDAGLVDKVRLFYAPKLAPGAADRESRSRKLSAAERSHASSSAKRATAMHELSRMKIEQFGPDFAVEGYLHDVYRR